MTLPHKKYPSKVLLFGEYTIIDGGAALSIPYNKCSGTWAKGENTDLSPFFEYLKTLSFINGDIVEIALKDHWIFQSDIPQGYGLGSSGALSAAAYDTFCTEKSQDLSELKNHLAEIESFFHGQSSGLDPLTSYCDQAILFEHGQCKSVHLTLPSKTLFLYDSEQRRDTKSLVKKYKEKRRSDTAFRKVTEELSELNTLSILSLRNANDSLLKDCIKSISQLQYDQFKEMIPDHINTVWKSGLQSGDYYFKLSGAGGGGNFLVFGDVQTLDQKLLSSL